MKRVFNLINNFYIELVSISANYNSIGLAPTEYSGPYFYGNADKIGIYYNHNSKKASICNTNSCGVIYVSSNLPITIGSGSPSENGSFKWVLESNIDQNLKNNAINKAR